MRPVHLSLVALPLLLGSCSLDSISSSIDNTLAVASVSFSSASPAYTGPDISYNAQGLIPHLSYFSLVMTFHVKADNTNNTHRAAFGSQSVKPVLKFRINSINADPIDATIPSFSIPGGQDTTLDFPVTVPLSSIADTAILRKIVAGDSIPYFLSGSISFDLQDVSGGIISGSAGTSDVELATGAIPTRPSSGILSVLKPLLGL